MFKKYLSLKISMMLTFMIILSMGIHGCQPQPQPDPPEPVPGGWAWKRATSAGDALNFLNGSGAYQQPISEVRIAAIWKEDHAEFFLFYRRDPTNGASGDWGWKLSTAPEDAHNFLNGLGAYSQPVKDAQIAVLWKGSHREFYIFYKRPVAGEVPVGSWGWKRAPDPSDAMNFLNGTGVYAHPVTTARIAALDKGARDEFYIFYQRSVRGEPVANWTWKLATTAEDAYSYINGIGVYGEAVPGFELGMLWKGSHTRFYIFANRGTQVWFQRPLNNERFIQGETVQLRALVTSNYPVDGSQLQWSSSLDGPIGQGAVMTMNNLALGVHTLTVAGYGKSVQSPVRLYSDLLSFYQAPPAQAEIDRINADFAMNWVDGTQEDEIWSTYPLLFDQQSTDPSKMVAYAKLDVLRHQYFSEHPPFTGGKTVYDHLKTFVNTINLRLDCNVNTGGGHHVRLNRSFSVWDGRSSGTSDNPDACKTPFQNPTLYGYVNPLYLLLHEGRHSEPDDSGHTSCDGKTNMDPSLENGSGHARAALYTMWCYQYGLYDPLGIRTEAKSIAQNLLNSRFCAVPSHSDPRVQAIVDELMGN
jgi:hypothetical protein